MNILYFGKSDNLSTDRNIYLELNREILIKVLDYQTYHLNLYNRNDKEIAEFFYIKEKMSKKHSNSLKKDQVTFIIEYLLKWLEMDLNKTKITSNIIDYMYELAQEFYETYNNLGIKMQHRDRGKDIIKTKDLISSVELEKERDKIKVYLASLLNISETEKEKMVKVRIGQGLFRKYLILRRFNCELCNVSGSQFLIASHIKPWRDCNNQEKLSPDNGLLFCPNHDWLFDQGYITFTSTGDLLISEELSEVNRLLFNVKPTMQIYLNERQHLNMNWHRIKVYRGNQNI